MKWIPALFSDGGKPSLARHLLTLVLLAYLVAWFVRVPIPEETKEIVFALAAWAGASRFAGAKNPAPPDGQ